MTDTDPRRPFEVDRSTRGRRRRVPDPRPTLPDPDDEHADRVAGAELMLTIDAALMWSSDCISQLIGLAEWKRYVDGGGDPAIVAANMLRSCDRIEELAYELPGLVERIQAVASATIEKAGS